MNLVRPKRDIQQYAGRGREIRDASPSHLMSLRYDPLKYDFRSHVATILEWAGPKIGFGSFGTIKQLEHFQAKEAPDRVFAETPRCSCKLCVAGSV